MTPPDEPTKTQYEVSQAADIRKRWAQIAIGAGLVAISFALARLGEQTTNPTPTSTPAAISAPTPAIDNDALKAEATGVWTAMISAVGPCDVAGNRAGASMQGDDIISAYTAFDAADGACLSTGVLIRRIDAPAHAEESTQQAFKGALQFCADAYDAKWAVVHRMKKFLDGDERPSKLAELRETMHGATAGLAQCTPKLRSLVEDAGGVAQVVDR